MHFFFHSGKFANAMRMQICPELRNAVALKFNLRILGPVFVHEKTTQTKDHKQNS